MGERLVAAAVARYHCAVGRCRAELSKGAVGPSQHSREWVLSPVMRSAILALVLMVGLLAAPRASADPVSTPAPSSPEGQAILAPALADLNNQLQKPANLDGTMLRTSQGWAFVQGQIKGPDGQWIDYSGTPFAIGNHSKKYLALVRASGQGWQLVTSKVGPTDVAWANWSQEYGAPAEIFPPS
jgi:hypothetical protein